LLKEFSVTERAFLCVEKKHLTVLGDRKLLQNGQRLKLFFLESEMKYSLSLNYRKEVKLIHIKVSKDTPNLVICFFFN